MKPKNHSLLKTFIRYVATNVCGMLGLSCYILADTFFVSNSLGASGLTALNLAIPVYSFVHGTGLMLGMGGASRYTLLKEQNRHESADHVFTVTLFLAAFCSILYVLLGCFLSPQITAWLGADESVFAMTNTYLKLICIFSPAFLLNDIFICFIRNDAAPKLSMTAMLLGSLSNVILDYVFMYPLGMGIFGAVLATGLAPVFSLCILSRHILTKRNSFHLKAVRPSRKQITDILSLGVSSLVTELASGIVMILFNIVILKISGNIGVAAYGVIANLSLVITAVYTGIAQGCQPIIGQAFGSNSLTELRRILRYAQILILAVSCLIYTALILFSNPVVAVFNSEHNELLQSIAVHGLKLYFTAIPFAGFNILLAMYFVGIGKAVPSQIISLARGFLLILPLALLLPAYYEMTGVWLAYPLTELLTAGISCFLLLRRKPL